MGTTLATASIFRVYKLHDAAAAVHVTSGFLSLSVAANNSVNPCVVCCGVVSQSVFLLCVLIGRCVYDDL